jgi:hypothetical protein
VNKKDSISLEAFTRTDKNGSEYLFVKSLPEETMVDLSKSVIFIFPFVNSKGVQTAKVVIAPGDKV